jgi:hypothetical protein
MSVKSKDYYYSNFINGNYASDAYVNDGGTKGDATYIELSKASNNKFGSGLNSSSSNNNNTKSGGKLTSISDVMNSGSGKSSISDYDSSQKVNTSILRGNSDAIQDEILKQLKKESDLHTQINEKMSITGDLSRSYRDTILDTLPNAAQLGFDISNITDMVTTLADNSKRFNLVSKDTMEKSFETARAFGMTLPQIAEAMSEFEKVGLGSADTLVSINTASRASMSLGLNSRKITKDLTDNLGKLNQYGFANGVEGLNRMAQKAAEFRMSMEQTFTVAEKVMNPESAIELTANMQMLGGAIGDLNDPLKLMYMATNNVEGLQDAIQGAASTLATYNKEQGRFEITGANLRRAQEMAKQLGVDYKEFAKGAIASQERIVANNTLLSKGFVMSDKDREFLTNMSQMKNGKMTITVPESLQDQLGKQSEIALNDLSQQQIDVLKENRKKLEEMNPVDIAKGQFTSIKNIENMLQSSALVVARGAKNRALGTNENVNKPGILNLQKISDEGLGYAEKLNKLVTNPPAAMTNFIDKQFTNLKSITDNLKTGIDLFNNNLKNALNGIVPKENEQKEKEKREYNERSNPRTNEFVLKSQINIVYNGFGLPQTEIKGGYLTGPNVVTKKGQ